ncbi:hypothetical protein BX600DRAFT_438061 [Xylariales sp. PMI_506]|nr:hypothetical protein BX600DRAFT_438061 [Xylariales sp. PMI_506]
MISFAKVYFPKDEIVEIMVSCLDDLSQAPFTPWHVQSITRLDLGPKFKMQHLSITQSPAAYIFSKLETLYMDVVYENKHLDHLVKLLSRTPQLRALGINLYKQSWNPRASDPSGLGMISVLLSPGNPASSSINPHPALHRLQTLDLRGFILYPDILQTLFKALPKILTFSLHHICLVQRGNQDKSGISKSADNDNNEWDIFFSFVMNYQDVRRRATNFSGSWLSQQRLDGTDASYLCLDEEASPKDPSRYRFDNLTCLQLFKMSSRDWRVWDQTKDSE